MIEEDTDVVAYLPKVLLTAQPAWAVPPLWRSEWRNGQSGALLRAFPDRAQRLLYDTAWVGVKSPAEPPLTLASDHG